MSRVVVLGADGFIGRHLVKGLGMTSSDSILAFDRFSDYRVGLNHPFENLKNVQIMPGNFFNRDDLINAVSDADYVFHLVSLTNPASSNNDPLIDIDSNIKGSVEMFEICIQKGVKKIIFISSGGTIYGDIDSDKINEKDLPTPRSPYGIGKLTIEHYLRYFRHKSGIDYIVYRVSNPFGPGQNIHSNQGVIPVFLYNYLTKNPITVFGDGTMIRDYIYIDDLINMMVGSFKKNNIYSEYNIGSGSGKTINDVIASIEARTGYSVEKKFIEAPLTYINKSVLDISRFSEEFGIKPKISFEDGIKKTWEYVRKI